MNRCRRFFFYLDILVQLSVASVAPGKVLQIPAHLSATTPIGTVAVALAPRHLTVSPPVSAVGINHVYEKPCQSNLTGTIAEVGAVL
ncbi:unnamed protein product [Rotaria magnacalcarata]|uniref:Secreted protein n=1 Tax=Rotaria magnacalcarata TaxID=392030 RepID=A0A8S3JX43_9BILA|nr:unnamed protein product [Rotaria magnacalcarata]